MNQIFKINKKDVVFQVFNEEAIIINLESGFYFSYGGVGVDIWKMLEVGIPFEDLDNRINDFYLGDSGEMTRILKQSLERLEKEGLIIRHEEQEGSNEALSESTFPPVPVGKKPAFTAPKLEKYEDMQDFLLVDPIHEINYSEPSKKDK